MKYKSALIIAGILTGLIGALVKIIVKEMPINSPKKQRNLYK